MQYCSTHNLDWDCALVKYYEALSHAQSLNEPLTPQLLHKIFDQIQSTLIPSTLLQDWAEQTYHTTTDYWTFRKQVSDCSTYTVILHLCCAVYLCPLSTNSHIGTCILISIRVYSIIYTIMYVNCYVYKHL